ncbi:RDD family protein [Streptomyces sp. NPDC048659]|uniref:RDD family protein n=1 Tax=Streptomyces sp. NPDC048659 TaxID=3155489 RepID=UPI0034422459
MATPPGGGGEVPRAGYYPDPSIPGYIRYWNGGAWVPGTSRPAPADGEAPPAPPAALGPQLAPSPAPAPVAVPAAVPAPVAPSVPAVEETGPVFFDTDPAPASAPAPDPDPAPVWHATTSVQTGFGGERDQRVSWGREDLDGAVGTAGAAGAVGTPGAPASSDAAQAPADPRAAAAPVWPRAGGAPAAEPPRAEPVRESAGLPGQGPAPVWPTAGGAAEERAAGLPGQGAQPAQPAPAAPASAAGAAGAAGTAARLGGMPVSPSWAPQAQQQQPQPQPAATPAPRTPQPQSQPQPRAQLHPQPQSHAQSHPQPQDPVVPWKPPVEDPFHSLAQAQASARPAGLGRRLVARLVDTLVLGAMAGAVAYPFVTAALAHIEEKIEAARQSGVTVQVWLVDSTTSVQFGIALAALLVLGVLYEALPTARWGRTLGKKLCGIQVRDIEAHEPPSFGAALRRWLVYSVLGLLVLGVLNVLWCLFDRPWRQCWHDKAARTFVAR